jgi:hypothetical protein
VVVEVQRDVGAKTVEVDDELHEHPPEGPGDQG